MPLGVHAARLRGGGIKVDGVSISKSAIEVPSFDLSSPIVTKFDDVERVDEKVGIGSDAEPRVGEACHRFDSIVPIGVRNRAVDNRSSADLIFDLI